MRKTCFLFGAGMAIFFVNGCAHETLVGHSDVGPPSWKLSPPPAAEGKQFFVGRATAVNILDQARGINDAKDDAARQIVSQAAASVDAESVIIQSTEGELIRGDDKVMSSQQRRLTISVKAVAAGAPQKGGYWEKWSIRESFLGREFDRYHYWVLVEYPQKELDKLRAQILEAAKK